MRQFKALLFPLFLVCVHITTFAQIQKGNYNFGGDVGLFLNSFSSNSFKGREAQFSLSPSIGKFLTNEWLVSIQPILSTENQNFKVSDLGGNQPYEYNLAQTNLGLGIASRYYVNMGEEIKLFGAVNGSYARQFNRTSVASSIFGNSDRKINLNLITYGGGVGFNVGVRHDVFLETMLSYNIIENSGADFAFRSRKNEIFSISCGLNHFVVNPKKADFAADVALIKKGRQMFGGGFSVTKQSDYITTMVNPKLSQFVTNNLLLSGEIAVNSIKGDGVDNQFITATASTRYYFPIQKRFFIYPELAYTRKYDNSNSFNHNKNEVAIGLGGNYFLSKNVALEANILQARFNIFEEKNDAQNTFTGLIGLGNVKLVYFIR